MKYDVYIIRYFQILFWVSISFLFPIYLISEEIPGPEGEQIIRQHFFKKNGQVTRIIATRYNIYSSHYSFANGWSSAKLMFSVPNGKRINDACKKYDDLEEKKTYCILLDAGDIYEFKYKPNNNYFDANPRIIPGPSVSNNQSSYRKLLVSNEYRVIFNYTIFMNKLDGSGWLADSSGIGDFYTYDLSYNSKGELFAGTNKGLYKYISGNYARINSVDTSSVISMFNDRWGKFYINLSNRKTMISLDSGNVFIDDSAGIGSRYVVRFGDDRWGNVYAITSYQNVRRLYKKSPNSDWIRIDTNISNYLGFYTSYNDIGGETTLEVSTYYGSFSSRDDGITWFTSNKGILAEDIYKLIFMNDGDMLAYTIFGVFLKDKDSTNWKRIFPSVGVASSYILFKDNSNNIYTQDNRLTGQNLGNIYKSEDLGENWIIDTSGIFILPRGYSGYSQLFVDEDGNQHYSNSFIWGASIDYLKVYEKKKNESWVFDTLGMGLVGLYDDSVYTIGTFANNNKTLYLSAALWDNTSGDDVLSKGLVYKRKFDENSWQIDTNGIGGAAIYSLTNDKNHNMLAGSLALDGKISVIFKNDGATWKPISMPPASSTDVRDMAVDSTGCLWVAFNSSFFSSVNYNGIYATTDYGKTWEYGGFDSVIVRGLVAFNNSMYAYTGRGIHKLEKRPFKAAKIEITPNSVDFGKVIPESIIDTLVNIKNIGDDTLRISSISSNMYIYPSETSLTIAPGDSEDLIITFKPLSAIKYSFVLRISSNTYPDSIYVVGEGIINDSSAIIGINTKNIDFPEVRSGKYKDSTIIISNSGYKTLKVYNIISSASVFTVQNRTFEVSPNSSIEIPIRFSPTSKRTYSGYLEIISNVMPDTVWLSGIGIEAAAPKLSLSLRSIDFGKVEVSQSKDTNVVIKNIGTDTLRISYIRTFSEAFSTSHHQINLAPEEEITATLTFKPQDEKIYSDNFAIVSNASPDTIFVYGEGYYYVNVEDVNLEQLHLSIYPNPTSDYLFIKYNKNHKPIKFNICNNLGVEVFNNSVSSSEQTNDTYMYDLSFLPQGIYFLRFSDSLFTSTYIISIIK